MHPKAMGRLYRRSIRTMTVALLVAGAAHAATPSSTAALQGTELPRRDVVLPSSAQAQSLLVLDTALARQELKVRLVGWRGADGRYHEGTPEGWDIAYPSTVGASDAPFMPVLIDASSADDVSAHTLIFRISTPTAEFTLPVHVAFQQIVRFVVDGPSEVRTLPDEPVTVPYEVRNTGNAPGTVTVKADSGSVTFISAVVPAGEARTVYVTLPASSVTRSVKLEFLGGTQPARVNVRLLGRYAPGTTPTYGVRVRVDSGVELPVASGALQPPASRSVVRIDGQVSRFSRVDATLEHKADGTLEGSADVQYRNTRVQVTDRAQDTPAGTVGKGVYATQSLVTPDRSGVFRIGVAVPVTPGPARFGLDARVRLPDVTVNAGASVNSDGADPALTFGITAAQGNAQVTVTPNRAATWTLKGKFAQGQASVEASVTGAPSHVDTTVQATVQKVPTPLGDATLRVQADTRDTALKSASASVTTRASEFKVTWAATTFTASAKSTFSLDAAQLTLRGSASVNAGAFQYALTSAEYAGPVGANQVKATLGAVFNSSGLQRTYGTAELTAPVTFGQLKLGTSVSSDGLLDVSGGVAHRAYVSHGQWKVDASVTAANLLIAPRFTATGQVAYSSFDGWGATLGVTMPLGTTGPMRVRFGMNYVTTVATPSGTAEWIDGPDPNTRTVRVMLLNDGVSTPLAGVTVRGCGASFTTDANGNVTARPDEPTCRFTVDPDGAPAGLVALTPGVDVRAGEQGVLTLVPAATLQGRIRYVDPETREPYDDGPQREVLVSIEGPKTVMVRANMPGGTFEVPALPVGTYTVRADNEPASTVTVTRAGASVSLTVTGPRRVVLNPAAVTRPVRLAWEKMLVPAGGQANLTVSSDGPIRAVRLVVNDQPVQAVLSSSEDGMKWSARLPVATDATGAQNVKVTVEFEDGTSTTRSTLFVATAATGSTEPAGRMAARSDEQVTHVLTRPVRLAWENTVVPVGRSAQLKVTSTHAIQSVSVTVGDAGASEHRHVSADGTTCVASLTPITTGATDVRATVLFADGVLVSRRTLLIVTRPPPAGQTASSTTFSPFTPAAKRGQA